MGKISLTSVDDLNSAFHCSIEYYSLSDIKASIAEEKKGQKRTTVLKLLDRVLKYKMIGKTKL